MLGKLKGITWWGYNIALSAAAPAVELNQAAPAASQGSRSVTKLEYDLIIGYIAVFVVIDTHTEQQPLCMHRGLTKIVIIDNYVYYTL